MSDYKESTVSGTTYRRGRSMYFENPRNGIPSVLIREEDVIVLADRVITQFASEINKTLDEPTTIVPLRDVATGEIIEGQAITYGAIHQALYSLYWKLATDRDAEQV